ncbi:hypothetical protein B0H17DRAFT_1201020 [Mycena rosella]|uniref:DUF6534 domain-containing protein n=1 Tax=Mycena rosella TaxID=1033263 RepID=A0AAD7DHU5_MYCRO|nr:hypothetical protein B0H17DRAFT_1201020 [Mycena rosella]
MLHLDTVVGVYLLGILLNTFLYGVVLAQFLTYFSTKSNDPLWMRVVVWSLLCTDTIHSAVEIYAAWEIGVVDFGNPARFASVSWTIPFTAVATSVAAIITQFFLAYRLWSLTKSKALVGIICASSVLGLIFGCISGVMSGIIKEVAKFGSIVPFVVLWLSFQSLSDFLITVSLITMLARWRTGFRRTDTIINRLIRGAIETGTFASAFALADLFSFVFCRKTNLYAMFAFPIGRIYTNTLLHTLNGRASLRDMNSIIECDSEGNARAFQLQDRIQRHTMSNGGIKIVPVDSARSGDLEKTQRTWRDA